MPDHLREHVVVRVKVQRRHRPCRPEPRVDVLHASSRHSVAQGGHTHIAVETRQLLKEPMLCQVANACT